MKNRFFEYLDTCDNMIGEQKSYNLVLLKCIFDNRNVNGQAKISDVMRKYREYYLNRKQLGFVLNNVEKNIDSLDNNVLWKHIKSQPYKFLNEKGFLSTVSKKDAYYFALPMSLITELDTDDYKEINRKIEEKLDKYFPKININDNKIMISNNKNKQKLSNKRIQTPFEKLSKRILNYFSKKKFIGDIVINNDEYNLLIKYFRERYRYLINTYDHTIVDPVFATALVQIGIRNYDGKFWGHVAKILELDSIKPNQQGWIGDSFVATLKKYGKFFLDEKVKVNNILMHGFVSDHYANDFFSFLFAYYRIDLERDIERMNTSEIQTLINVMTRDDNTGRTYWLVKQTADAIRSNVRGSKIRIRRFLRLMDKYFWEGGTQVKFPNRLTQRFYSWQENSNEFQSEYNKFNGSNYSKFGKKLFSAPYLKCDLKKVSFKLILPPQLVRFEGTDNIFWKISINDDEKLIQTEFSQAVTGYKTEQKEINFYNNNLFDLINIELISNSEKIRTFKIKNDCIRFFDKDGDFVRTDSIPVGEIYSFTDSMNIVSSPALIDNEKYGRLILSYFDFQYGDIVRLPDGKPLSIGKKIEEGLIQRGILKNVYSVVQDEHIPIYKSMPSVLIKMQKSRAKGTMIKINNNIYRMFDKETVEIDLKDRSGETGFLINLEDFDCHEDGIYEIYIDVPRDRTNRHWKFAYINGIKYEFEDSPYIFKTRGTIAFNSELKVKEINNLTEKIKDQNTFNLSILPERRELSFEAITQNDNIILNFEIPVLNWKFDDGEWQIEKPSEIWHSDFPTKISFTYPDDKIKLSMDENFENDDCGEQSDSFIKSKEKGIIECDVTRFKSWFGREVTLRTLNIELSSKQMPFIDVVTKSTIVSALVKGDFDKDVLIGEFDIIGKANYYCDIEFAGNVIASKIRITEGKFEVNSKLQSGVYEILLFEDEDDDTGFGEQLYIPIGKHSCRLVNPYDLQGNNIKINHIRKGEESIFNMMFSCTYKVKNLTRVSDDDKHNYNGKMVTEGSYGSRFTNIDVNVEFYDLNKLRYCHITFIDNEELTEFLYDYDKRIIVRDEEKGLPPSTRYRRYEVVYPEDYVYVVKFENDIYEARQKVKKADSITEKGVNVDKKITIANEMDELIDKTIILTEDDANKDKSDDILDTLLLKTGMSPLVYNCLKKSKIHTIRDIKELIDLKGIKVLNNINMLNTNMKNEVIDILREYSVI